MFPSQRIFPMNLRSVHPAKQQSGMNSGRGVLLSFRQSVNTTQIGNSKMVLSFMPMVLAFIVLSLLIFPVKVGASSNLHPSKFSETQAAISSSRSFSLASWESPSFSSPTLLAADSAVYCDPSTTYANQPAQCQQVADQHRTFLLVLILGTLILAVLTTHLFFTLVRH